MQMGAASLADALRLKQAAAGSAAEALGACWSAGGHPWQVLALEPPGAPAARAMLCLTRVSQAFDSSGGPSVTSVQLSHLPTRVGHASWPASVFTWHAEYGRFQQKHQQPAGARRAYYICTNAA